MCTVTHSSWCHGHFIQCHNHTRCFFVLSIINYFISMLVGGLSWLDGTLSIKAYRHVNYLRCPGVFGDPLHSARPSAVTAGLCSHRLHISITWIELVTQVQRRVTEEQFPHNDLLLILDFIPSGIVTLRAAGENYLPAFQHGSKLYLYLSLPPSLLHIDMLLKW